MTDQEQYLGELWQQVLKGLGQICYLALAGKYRPETAAKIADDLRDGRAGVTIQIGMNPASVEFLLRKADGTQEVLFRCAEAAEIPKILLN